VWPILAGGVATVAAALIVTGAVSLAVARAHTGVPATVVE